MNFERIWTNYKKAYPTDKKAERVKKSRNHTLKR